MDWNAIQPDYREFIEIFFGIFPSWLLLIIIVGIFLKELLLKTKIKRRYKKKNRF